MFKRKKNGFTLIELIIVVALMGLLAIVGLTNYQTSLQNGRDNRRRLDLKSVASAIQVYYSDNLAYPAQASYGSIPGIGVLAPNYLKTIPADPKFTSAEGYRYKSYGSSNQCYCLGAKMERASNAKDETGNDTNCTSSPPFPTPYYLIGCP